MAKKPEHMNLDMENYRGDQSGDFRRKITETKTKEAKTFAEPTRASVNVPQGPRTGVAARAGKREAFMDRKDEALDLAGMVNRAYALRQERDYADKNWPGEGAVDQDVKPKRFKR
jgi:hypothetical protein